jgi:hypothetical protein
LRSVSVISQEKLSILTSTIMKNILKPIRFLAVIAFFSFFFSCDDDGGGDCVFFQEDMNGKIAGVDWRYKAGTAEFVADNIMSVDIFGQDEDLIDGACSLSFGMTSNVFFSVRSELGEYSLNLDFSGGSNQIVTMFDMIAADNIIVTEGCISVSRITDTEVDIKFNVKSDDNNFMDGEATLEICQ